MSNRPNILWIFGDQMRGHAMSCAGDSNLATPHLDRMAREGVRFTNACSTFPVCVPFRFSLYTGHRASTRWVPNIDYRLSPAERTVAHELNDAGYQTAHVGKWHLRGGFGPDPIKSWGKFIPIPRFNQAGFQRFKAGQSFEHEDPFYFAEGDPEPRQLQGYHTDAFFTLAMDEIAEMSREDKPWFMSLSVSPPHPLYIAPDFSPNRPLREIQYRGNVDIERYTSFYTGMMNKPPATAEEDPNRGFQRMMTEYYLMIENLDANVGRIRKWLGEKGLAENTIVVFFSDHGDMLASHGLHGKTTYYEESCNIPLIVHIPEQWRRQDYQPGRIIDYPTCTEDFFPTALDWAGIDPPQEYPGTSFAPWANGEPPRREGVFLEATESVRGGDQSLNPYRAYRTRHHKYVIDKNGPAALFDLQKDPLEQISFLDDPEYQQIRVRMHETLINHLVETEDSFYYVILSGRKRTHEYESI